MVIMKPRNGLVGNFADIADERFKLNEFNVIRTLKYCLFQYF